jgi:hypothetical protein
LEADPGIRRVGLDPAGCRHLRDEQLAGCPVELVCDRRSASFDTRALSVCTIADDFGKAADTAVHEFGLGVPVASGPMLDCGRRRVATECALHLLQFRLAGKRPQRVLRAFERKRHPQPVLEDEDEQLAASTLMLPRFDPANPVGGVDDEITHAQTKGYRGLFARNPSVRLAVPLRVNLLRPLRHPPLTYADEKVTFVASGP